MALGGGGAVPPRSCDGRGKAVEGNVKAAMAAAVVAAEGLKTTTTRTTMRRRRRWRRRKQRRYAVTLRIRDNSRAIVDEGGAAIES
jgi:hypothetical protein